MCFYPALLQDYYPCLLTLPSSSSHLTLFPANLWFQPLILASMTERWIDGSASVPGRKPHRSYECFVALWYRSILRPHPRQLLETNHRITVETSMGVNGSMHVQESRGGRYLFVICVSFLVVLGKWVTQLRVTGLYENLGMGFMFCRHHVLLGDILDFDV